MGECDGRESISRAQRNVSREKKRGLEGGSNGGMVGGWGGGIIFTTLCAHPYTNSVPMYSAMEVRQARVQYSAMHGSLKAGHTTPFAILDDGSVRM